MSETLKCITGYVALPEGMLQKVREYREAERQHEERLRTDPEYAERWARHMNDWDEHEDSETT